MSLADRSTLPGGVREILAHLHDRTYLERHPIGSELSRTGQRLMAEDIYRLIIQAIDQLRPLGDSHPQSPEWRRYRYLTLRYVDGMTPEKVADDLGLSERQARRVHQEAVDSLTTLLWQQHGGPISPVDLGSMRVDSIDPIKDAGEIVAEGLEGMEAEVARVETHPGRQRSDLGETLNTALQTLSALVAKQGAHVSLSLPPDPPVVAIERTVLRQVFLLLLMPLLESGSGYLVKITAGWSAEDELVVDVVGQHPGGQRATMSFQTAASSESQKRLEIGIRLVAMCGGSVETSNGLDPIWTLRIRLPAIQPTTILVVDDNPGVPRLFRRFLQGYGYRVLDASTAQGAIALAREAQPDVIILDVILPAYDGWEILQRLQSADSTRHIPVIVCSVLPERPLALALGITDFLPKPVTRQSLLAALARCLPTEAAVSREPF